LILLTIATSNSSLSSKLFHIYSNKDLKGLKNSPRANPSAGETKRVPKVENAPDTGYIDDISPLSIKKVVSTEIITRNLIYRVIIIA
jgi:hypothetical protein